jgi:hypothetical protein
MFRLTSSYMRNEHRYLKQIKRKALLGLKEGITQMHMVPSEKGKPRTLSQLFWVQIILSKC